MNKIASDITELLRMSLIHKRESLNLGMREAASQMEISPATLSRIEHGKTPDLATFAAICRWVDLDPGEVLGIKKIRQHKPDGVVKKARPTILPAIVPVVETGCGKMYVTLGSVDNELFEVFAALGKAGACTKALLEGLSRSITLSLRCGVPPELIAKQLLNIRCPNAYIGHNFSCVDGIGKAISGMKKEIA